MKVFSFWFLCYFSIFIFKNTASIAQPLNNYIKVMEETHGLDFHLLVNQAIDVTSEILKQSFSPEKLNKENILFIAPGRSPFLFADILEISEFPVLRIPITEFRMAKPSLISDEINKIGWVNLVRSFSDEDQVLFSSYIADNIENNHYRTPRSIKYSIKKIKKIIFLDYTSRQGISLFSFCQFAIPELMKTFKNVQEIDIELLLNNEDIYDNISMNNLTRTSLYRNFESFELNNFHVKPKVNTFDIGSRDQLRPINEDPKKIPKKLGHVIWNPNSLIDDFAPFGEVKWNSIRMALSNKTPEEKIYLGAFQNLTAMHNSFLKDRSRQMLHETLYNYIFFRIMSDPGSAKEIVLPYPLPSIENFKKDSLEMIKIYIKKGYELKDAFNKVVNGYNR